MASKAYSPNRQLFWFSVGFLVLYFTPFESQWVQGALQEAFLMLSDYARQHVLLCLIPAFFIAGAITVFINQQAVIRYLGPKAPKWLAYSVASISGAVLAVCSCTVLPLFKGIYKKGAGLGPAISFLYSGPAINVIAIILSLKVLGFKLGLARMVGAVVFAVIIGLLMHLLFRKEDETKGDERLFQGIDQGASRTLGQDALYLAVMVGILVFLNWANTGGKSPLWDAVAQAKWWISGGLGLVLVWMLWKWFTREELMDWVVATRDFSLQILPLLFVGVFIAGLLLGRPGQTALIPQQWITNLVGGNSLLANFFASISGAFMYFATLTEIPILQGLLGAGMGQGPALALLLAGPSLSLPSMLVIGSELGFKKTFAYVSLVVIMSTLVGWVFGMIV
ncbi:permease [Thermospira aquatica]|uniref:Permease n=1 Tax=Thermospira aquatica TaxID=2828656 RepID=A0AAX3BFI0_9SPIR|nr:permease [Thermospira aquatica]URA11040.1 permease [Thermospira aquatica]